MLSVPREFEHSPRTLGVGVFFCLIVGGCSFSIAPFPDYAKGWVGAPIDQLVAASKRPQSYASRSNSPQRFYQLESGNEVYASPEWEGCIVHWEFNRERIIVGYKTEGDQCY